MAVAPFTPAWLERLVRRCLAKDPERRYQSMRDIVLDLDSPPQEAPTAAAKPNRWPWAIAAACALLAIAVGIFPIRKTFEPPAQFRFDINPPPGGSFTNGGSAISPDGKTLAFVARNAKGESLLHLRLMDSLEARVLPGSEDARQPFWSPDSKSLGFAAGGKLKRIDVAGGAPITLCDAPATHGGAWSQDGVILFAQRGAGLQRIAASGGAPVPVTTIDSKSESFHYYPQFLPGGKEFLFLVGSNDVARAGIYWGSFDGRLPVQIVATGFRGLYDANSRRLLYLQNDRGLMARGMELNPPRVIGDPAMVTQGVRGNTANGSGDFSTSGTGTLVYRRGGTEAKRRFGWTNRAGTLLKILGQPFDGGGLISVSLSRDGSRVAYQAGTPPDIWVMTIASGIATRVSFSGGFSPLWSPDGKQIYYSNGDSIYRKAADGSGGEELLVKGAPSNRLSSVSPDGKNLLFGNRDILRLSLEGGNKPEPYLQTKFNEGNCEFSPDGRWVAYQSDESGRSEIYIQGFPEPRGKWQISAEGGSAPQWRADGKELYWNGSDPAIVMAAPVELQAAAVKSGRPELLFRGRNPVFVPFDGKRFLVTAADGGEHEALPMAVVTNWAAGLGK